MGHAQAESRVKNKESVCVLLSYGQQQLLDEYNQAELYHKRVSGNIGGH